ncbi:MAG: LysR family transcriptional regulator, partial [Chromatocurvus sp.]
MLHPIPHVVPVIRAGELAAGIGGQQQPSLARLAETASIKTDKRNPTLDISYKELERFVMVLELGGLAEAARVLGITQQALGRSLTKLEQIVGVKLVNRAQGSQTRPTLYGEAFLQYARGQLNGIEQAVHHVQALNGARAGKVTIGIGEICDVGVVARAVHHFHLQRPDVEISLLEDYSETLLNQLIEGELDCVLGAIG